MTTRTAARPLAPSLPCDAMTPLLWLRRAQRPPWPPTCSPRSRRTGSSSRLTATGCSARASRPRTPCRRRWCGPGGRSTASRAAPRCGRGSTASRPTSASTCSGAPSAGPGRWTSARRGTSETLIGAGVPEHAWVQPVADARVVPADGDPAEQAVARDSVRLAFVAAPAAPAATAAGRAAPQGGPAVAGVGGGRAPRHHRRLRQQRPAAGSGPRWRPPMPTPPARTRWTTSSGPCWPATWRPSSATTSAPWSPCSARTPCSRCRRSSSGCRAQPTSAAGSRARARGAAAPACSPPPPTAAPPSPSTG
jgi:hypothetical protein